MVTEKKDENRVGSGSFSFNMNDVIEVIKTGLLVGIAAFLTFIVQNLGKVEMGEGILVVLPMIVIGLNAAVQWIKDNTTTVVEEDEEDEGGDDEEVVPVEPKE